MIKAVILDMDGVLIDSEPLWQQAEIEIFQTVNITLNTELCQRTTGLRIDEVVDYWHQQYPWESPSPEAIAERIVARVVELIRTQGEPKPGVRELFAFLGTMALPLGLATSSAYSLIDAVCDRLQIRDYFRAIYSATEEPYGKPHPGVYIAAAGKLNVAPADCLAVEDSLNGVLAAKAARMICIAVPEDYPQQKPGFAIADRIVGSLHNINAELWQALS